MKLALWIIYNKPTDYPDKYVARKWLLDVPTDVIYTDDTLEGVRAKIPPYLFRMERDPKDDPVIVETWI